jgi:hypothetical protein
MGDESIEVTATADIFIVVLSGKEWKKNPRERYKRDKVKEESGKWMKM